MTPLPLAIDPSADLVAWRLDSLRFAGGWDAGIGAERTGGRWNPKGFKAVYCAFDPSTCILESAVHRGFPVLDTSPHMLTSLTIQDPADVHIVRPEDVPNPAWLHGGVPSKGQQAWGAGLLAQHGFVAFPSAASKLSWNVVFEPGRAAGKYAVRSQDRLVLDTRLNPPPP